MFLVFGGEHLSRFNTSLNHKNRLNQSQTHCLDLNSSTSNESVDHPCFVLDGLNELLNESENKVNKFFSQCLEEMALKLTVNAVSTGAHILIGKTYKNLMIDVRVSNFKLYNRAISIIQKLSNARQQECELYLLKSIYKDRELSQDELKNIQAHIAAATCQEQIVPKALIMLLAKVSETKADRLLDDSNKSVRNCISNLKLDR